MEDRMVPQDFQDSFGVDTVAEEGRASDVGYTALDVWKNKRDPPTPSIVAGSFGVVLAWLD